LFDERKFKEAAKIFPCHPFTYIYDYEMNRKQYNQLGFDAIHNDVIKPAMQACANDIDITLFAADICMRYDKWTLAIEYLEKTFEIRPNNPQAFISLASCYRALANVKTQSVTDQVKYKVEAIKIMKYCKEISLQNVSESINWIYADSAEVPTPYEG